MVPPPYALRTTGSRQRSGRWFDDDVMRTSGRQGRVSSEAGIEPLFGAKEYPEFGTGFYAVTFCDADNNVIEFGHRDARAGH